MSRLERMMALFVALAFVGCEEHLASEQFEFKRPCTSISLDVDFGDVIIETDDTGDSTRVSADIECRTSIPDYSVYTVDKTLVIEMDAEFGASACKGDFKILVPARVSANIRTGRGDVEVEGLSNSMEIVSFDGDITLSGVRGDFDITAVSGDIKAVDVASNKGRLTIGAGDAHLEYLLRPQIADIDIMSGNANLIVPAATYSIEVAAETGQVVLQGISDNNQASNSLVLSVDTGDIRISNK